MKSARAHASQKGRPPGSKGRTAEPAQPLRRNRLITHLPRSERARLLSVCETVPMRAGVSIGEAGARSTHILFPLSGFVSLTAEVEGHPPLGMSLIGNEGMVGMTLVLGVDAAPARSVVQGSGSALRVLPEQFRSALKDCPRLRRTLDRYLHVQMVQLSQNAACIHFHFIEARLARQLLMTQDCVGEDHFHLTHQCLADLLGVRRSAITLAAGALRAHRAISYSRGNIRILDRERLEGASCACYGLGVDAYAAWLP
ncbi:MAG: Crp/Fnr family transcriptional regulator [Panacagrimonas sp.]|nr:Crp/Fnr family transcriptional regulator [Panacagrimonas sp.]